MCTIKLKINSVTQFITKLKCKDDKLATIQEIHTFFRIHFHTKLKQSIDIQT